MRRLLRYWRKGDKTVRIGRNQIDIISAKLALLADYTPSDFSRKPRCFMDSDRFKATELRQILLYTGPTVFRNILQNTTLKHFILLHVAISILADNVKVQNQLYINYAEELLKLFVQEMRKIYKNESVVYNVHNSVHLADDVRQFG